MPTPRESRVKTALVKKLKERGHYARRIEDQYGVGILDIVTAFKNDDKTWFIEVKIINGNYFGMTERQGIEALKLQKTGNSSVAVCVAGYNEREGTWYISAPTVKVHVDDCMKQETGELFENLLTRWRNTQ